MNLLPWRWRSPPLAGGFNPHRAPPPIRYPARMENIQQQVAALQKSVQRQRIAIFVLAGICTAGVLVGATKPTEDATFDTITCKKWVVVDGDGKNRILGGTSPDGAAALSLYDKDEKPRIVAGTLADGGAALSLYDKDGKPRILAATLADGNAKLQLLDEDEKPRIVAASADGNAALALVDKDGKPRIMAGTLADGTVMLPIRDMASPKK
jgi:hypothetical protein